MNFFKCRYCGRTIGENARVIQVQLGEIKTEYGVQTFEPNDERDIVHYHENCFLSMTDDPRLLDRL
jgi:hypothetical protein